MRFVEVSSVMGRVYKEALAIVGFDMSTSTTAKSFHCQGIKVMPHDFTDTQSFLQNCNRLSR
jgi:hypothetical protein